MWCAPLHRSAGPPAVVPRTGHAERVRLRDRNEMSSMSSRSVESGEVLASPDEQAGQQPDEQAAEHSDQMPSAEVVVKGRNVEIPDHFRIYVSEKLARLERFDRSIYIFDVELKHAPNRRQRKSCQRVEITARGRGPVSRAEACANSFYAAFEYAVDKLENRLRRVKDRRKVHYGDKTPVSLAAATAVAPSPASGRGPRNAGEYPQPEAAFNSEP